VTSAAVAAKEVGMAESLKRGRDVPRAALLILVLFWPARTVSLAGQTKQPPQSLCYAFQHNGDVYVSCEGKRQKVTEGGTVVDFALARDGSGMALNRFKFTIQPNGAAKFTWDRVEVVLLSRHLEMRTLRGMGLYSLVPSCGTVLLFQEESPAEDLLDGSRLSFDDYKHFRCSADRMVVVGESASNPNVLMTGVTAKSQIAGGKALWGPFVYDVSPKGRYVAYCDRELCATKLEGNPQCIRAVNGPDRVSVTDSGEVIFDIGTGESCFYRDMWHVSLAPLPGYERDECLGVAYWKPGDETPTILERLGRNPQWITPRAAEALCAWHSRTHNSTQSR
jgi:hypothetical protein